MTSDNIQKVFVKPDDTTTIQCPVCHLITTVNVEKFRATRHTITTRCACGHSFPVNLEFRKHYRKETSLLGKYENRPSKINENPWKKTNLTGVYSMKAPATGRGHMQVTNISTGGLRFTIPGRHTIKVGDQVRVTFTLDNLKQTEIDKRVIVQSIAGHIISCQFTSDEPLEQDLRFYLFP